MKPLGMTPFFQIIHPTVQEDAIWRAVEEVIAAGWSLDRIQSEVREAFSGVHRRLADEADHA